MERRKFLLSVVVIVSCLLLAGTSVVSAQETVRLSVATGGTGGVYYPLGGGMAKALSKYLPKVDATAEVTAASVDNILLLKTKKAELALVMADVAYDGLKGTGQFKAQGPTPIRTVAVLYSNFMHFVALEGKGINSVADLKGKRVSTGAPGSGTEVKSLRVLEAYGINPDKDIRRERLSVAESAGALKDGKVDAFTWDGGLPTAAILDLAATPGIKIKLLDHGDAVPKMVQKYGPVYFPGVIPKATYPGMTSDVKVAAVANLLISHQDMDRKLAYGVVKTILEHQPDLVAVHKEAKNITPQTVGIGSSLPFHLGVEDYFKEKKIEMSK